jgi:hypothetical protein
MTSNSKWQGLIEKAYAKHGIIKFHLAAGIRMRHEHMTANNITEDVEMTFSGNEIADFIASCDEHKIKHLCDIAKSIDELECDRLH